MTSTASRFRRAFFLRGLAAIYTVSFCSIYMQVQGLYGEDGLEPVSVYLEKVVADKPELNTTPFEQLVRYPTLVWFHAKVGLPPDLMMELLCLVGMVSASLAMSGAVLVSPLFALIWSCYLSVFLVGQTFLSFQWDLLLLEVGFLAIWLAGPLDTATFEPPASIIWTLRFAFFKFMFMAGAVKIQSSCPTWLGLTALDFHYATQCLPLPTSWFAHQLPPIIQRISVASALFIEGPATFLIMSPFSGLRTFAAGLQILLQIMILLTGNYNFFNYLTCLLAISLIDAAPATQETIETTNDTAVALPESRTQPTRGLAWYMNAASWLAALGFLGYSLILMFDIVYDNEQPVSLRYGLTVSGTQELIHQCLPYMVMLSGMLIALFSFEQIIQVSIRAAKDMLRLNPLSTMRLMYLMSMLIVAMATFSSSVVTLSTLDRPYQESLPRPMLAFYMATSKFHIASPYGLFRTMTGVGKVKLKGQEYSIVARPEIVFEGSADGGETWKEYHFKHKPGDVMKAPTLVAPHQPRLDWQMWFAALTEYSQAPWVVHLASKLLHNSSAVKSLMDTERDPFPDTAPQLVRANLYHYDFTRWNTSWATSNNPHALILNSSTTSNATSQWWSRTYVKEYLPALERDNPSLQKFLESYMWTQPEIANIDPLQRCQAKVLCTWLIRLHDIPNVQLHIVASCLTPTTILALLQLLRRNKMIDMPIDE